MRVELREKIVAALESIEGYRGLEHERQADAILEIPEIAEALLAAARTRFLDAMGEDVDLSDLPNP